MRGGDRAQRLQRPGGVRHIFSPTVTALKSVLVLVSGMYKPTTTDHDSSRWPSSSSFREVTTHVNINPNRTLSTNRTKAPVTTR